MLRKCNESVRDSNVSFHKLDGFTLQGFYEKRLDLVYSHDVFVHFSSLQVYPYFKEIKRVLKPGGVGIVSFFDFVADFQVFKDQSLEFWNQRRYPPHMRHHFQTEEMIRLMLQDLELQTVRIHRGGYLIAIFKKPGDIREVAASHIS